MENSTAYDILADMSIDIDAEAASKYDIGYIPMEFILGEESHMANRPWDQDRMHEYYEQLRNKVPTRTSQITPHSYGEFFEPYVEKGRPVIYICLSSGLSKTYESALLAVEELKEKHGRDKVRIEVVDSLGATGGMGMLCEAAGINREHGVGFKENAAWLREAAKHIHYWFMVEDLMYLKRGGRISGATAIVGTALNIKPILKVNSEGSLENISKKRGSRLAMKYLVELFKESADDSVITDGDMCGMLSDIPDKGYLKDIRNIVYICCADRIADAAEVKKAVLEADPQAEVRVTQLSPVIGAHTGPDLLALIHFGKRKG